MVGIRVCAEKNRSVAFRFCVRTACLDLGRGWLCDAGNEALQVVGGTAGDVISTVEVRVSMAMLWDVVLQQQPGDSVVCS